MYNYGYKSAVTLYLIQNVNFEPFLNVVSHHTIRGLPKHCYKQLLSGLKQLFVSTCLIKLHYVEYCKQIQSLLFILRYYCSFMNFSGHQLIIIFSYILTANLLYFMNINNYHLFTVLVKLLWIMSCYIEPEINVLNLCLCYLKKS